MQKYLKRRYLFEKKNVNFAILKVSIFIEFV